MPWHARVTRGSGRTRRCPPHPRRRVRRQRSKHRPATLPCGYRCSVRGRTPQPESSATIQQLTQGCQPCAIHLGAFWSLTASGAKNRVWSCWPVLLPTGVAPRGMRSPEVELSQNLL